MNSILLWFPLALRPQGSHKHLSKGLLYHMKGGKFHPGGMRFRAFLGTFPQASEKASASKSRGRWAEDNQRPAAHHRPSGADPSFLSQPAVASTCLSQAGAKGRRGGHSEGIKRGVQMACVPCQAPPPPAPGRAASSEHAGRIHGKSRTKQSGPPARVRTPSSRAEVNKEEFPW